MLKGKKGQEWMSRETLSAVLLIVFLTFLILGGARVSQIIGSNKAKAQATGTLERLSFFLEGIGEQQTEKFLLYSPKGYYLIDGKGFDLADPFACQNTLGCACICAEESCSGKEAYCKGISKPLLLGGEQVPIKIGITELNVKNEANRFSIIMFVDIKETALTTKASINPEIKVEMPGFLPAPERDKGAFVDTIVLHHTAGSTFQGAYSEFTSRPNEVSSHYILDKDGTIYYTVDEKLKALHAGSYNDRSIGIEIVNTGNEPFTDKQYESLNLLLKDIDNRYPGIFYDDSHIIGHYQTPQGIADGKTDPSSYFEWARIGLPNHVPSNFPKRESTVA